MKNKNKFSICFILMILSWIGFYGCESLQETYDEFVDQGETIYIGAPDTVYVDPGYNKLRFQIAMNADPKITKGVLSSLNDEIYYEFEVVRNKEGNDTIPVIVEGEEGEYTFEIFLMDDQGNRSVRREVPATIYGDNYQNSLLTRRIVNMEPGEEGLLIDWGELFDGMIYTVLQYSDSQGETRKIEISNDDKSTLLHGLNSVEEIMVYSVYLPEDNAFEEFESDSVKYQIPQQE